MFIYCNRFPFLSAYTIEKMTASLYFRSYTLYFSYKDQLTELPFSFFFTTSL